MLERTSEVIEVSNAGDGFGVVLSPFVNEQVGDGRTVAVGFPKHLRPEPVVLCHRSQDARACDLGRCHEPHRRSGH